MAINFVIPGFDQIVSDADSILAPINLETPIANAGIPGVGKVTWPKFMGLMFVGAIGLTLLVSPGRRR